MRKILQLICSTIYLLNKDLQMQPVSSYYILLEPQTPLILELWRFKQEYQWGQPLSIMDCLTQKSESLTLVQTCGYIKWRNKVNNYKEQLVKQLNLTFVKTSLSYR